MTLRAQITYRITRELDEETVTREIACLDVEERRRAAQLVHAVDRRDFIAAHVLLRHALSAFERRVPGHWMFASSAAGKPHLAGDETREDRLAFNLSHTRGLVACVVARGADVGIDVERVVGAADVLDLARGRFAAAEVSELERCAPGERAGRFTEIWTLKEARAKATGAGIAFGFDGSAFTLGSASSSSLLFQPAAGALPGAWHFALFALLDYRLAVAVRARAADAVAFSVGECASAPARASGARLRLLRGSPELVVSGV